MKTYIKLFEQWLFEKKADTHDFGCVMLFFDFPQLKDIQNKIDPKDVFTVDEDRSFGLEDEPHVTLLYGIHSNEVNDSDVFKLVENIPYGSLTLQNVSTFKNDYDVLKFDVLGNGLVEANRALTSLPHTNNFPDYHPHSTIGYLKSGTADKYIDAFSDAKYVVSPKTIVYSKPSGEKITIKIKPNTADE